MKTEKTVMIQALIETSAKSENLGIAQSRKMSGEITAPNAILIMVLVILALRFIF